MTQEREPEIRKERKDLPVRKDISFVDTKMGGPYGQLDNEDLEKIKTKEEKNSNQGKDL